MAQNRTNSYDETKKMLQTLRKIQDQFVASKYLNEDVDMENQDSDIAVIDDVEIKINSTDAADLELDEETKNAISQMIGNFKTQVSQIVEFDPGMTINPNQIRLDGSLTDEEISFVLIAGEENGLYINADMLKLNEEVMTMLDKLQKFEEPYISAMNPLIDKRKNNIDIEKKDKV